jgi:hypothetical protein
MSDPLFQDRTPRLALPLLFAGQSQRESFVNEALARLDALVHCAIEAQLSAPPAAPEDGKCWLVGPNASGAWTGQDGTIACLQQGQWLFQQPGDGLRLLNKATGQHLHHLGTWRAAARPVLPTGGSTIDNQARAVIAALVDALVTAGILAGQ